MKRFFGKRRATRSALGELSTPPLGRLGALVFQLNNSDKLYWASLWAPTRIAGCALSLWPIDIRWEDVSSENRLSRLAAQLDQNNGGFTEIFTISFSLCPVVAEQSRKTPDSSVGRRRERMHPQSTDELSAQVALLQSPILSAVKAFYHFPCPKTTHKK